MAQLMPLPLSVSCFSKIQIIFTFLIPAHLGSPGKGPLNACVLALFGYDPKRNSDKIALSREGSGLVSDIHTKTTLRTTCVGKRCIYAFSDNKQTKCRCLLAWLLFSSSFMPQYYALLIFCNSTHSCKHLLSFLSIRHFLTFSALLSHQCIFNLKLLKSTVSWSENSSVGHLRTHR